MLARLLLAAAASLSACAAFGQSVPPAFTYQGELRAAGTPATGVYDLRFRLYAAASGGSAVAAELCANNIQVADGRFSVLLDFGASFPAGADRFLEIDVRPDAGTDCSNPAGYVTLASRQRITATPYALTAADASTLSGQPASFYLNAANLTGSVSDARLSPNVPLRGGTNTYTGANTFSSASNAFTGNGAGLTALSASALSTGTVPAARLPALTGDVTGTIAANRVGALQGFPINTTTPAAGQVLKFNGSQWTPAADVSASAGAGLAQSGATLSIASNGVTSAMLAADLSSLGKVTQSLLEIIDDGVRPPSIVARSAGATIIQPSVLSVAGGDAHQLVLDVEGTNAASILMLAGRGVTNFPSGGFIDIEAGNGVSPLVGAGGSGGQFFMRAGHGGATSSGRGGIGGRLSLSAGNGGAGRNGDSGLGGDLSLSAGDSPAPSGAGARDVGGNIYLNPGTGIANGGVGINVPSLASLNADLRIRGNGTLGRVVLESGGADQVVELLFSENTSNTNGVYLREDGVANALEVIDLTSGAETQIAAFDRDTNGFSAGIKAFKIDHPLDPANKLLYHSCVESPDMMNLYNGVVTTDAAGYATVDLPSYFAALNRDFRYQLTVLGDDDEEFVLAKVARKIDSDNRFTIRTSRGNVEVSWMVTGIRHDALADKHRLVPEVDKSPSQRGKYIHPEAFEPTKSAD